jgi:quercetin dioxygenase-like cupin family protein
LLKGEAKGEVSTLIRMEEVNMRVTKISEVRKESLSDPLFTGPDVTRQVLLPDSKEFNVNVVNFGKGVRNKFHAHDSEQILVVTFGKGVIATETEEKVITPGDVVIIPAGEKHRHGATKDSKFSHIYVSRLGSKLTQLEE